MLYVDFTAVRELLAYNARIQSGIAMPPQHELEAWLDDLRWGASDEGNEQFESVELAGYPYSALTTYKDGPPVALRLVMGQEPQSLTDDPRNIVADEDEVEVVAALETWDTKVLRRAVQSDEGWHLSTPPRPEPPPPSTQQTSEPSITAKPPLVKSTSWKPYIVAGIALTGIAIFAKRKRKV